MTVTVSDNSKRFIISLLIFFGINGATAFSQKVLSGNLNQPFSHVITIGADRVTVDNVSGFSAGDTILLIQMQGVKVLLSPVYGNLQGNFGEPGMHEFMIISAVNGGNEIVFARTILKAYDPLGNIQIVRVPYYNSATVTNKLFCNPWDPATKKGGVLALIIGKTLELKADIDVSKSGFLGGKDVTGDGICLPSPLDYYPETFTNAGHKGEGVANFTEYNQPLLPNYSKGIGNQWNGGGGGSGRFSGGGGGSNRGAGGNGGYEDCFPSGLPAVGGLKATHPSLLERIFFGGGGGGSTSSTGLAPAGGAGGGIVIVVADDIKGNGGKIISNGGAGYNAVANSGSGGGGAGGSIALSLGSYGSAQIDIQLKGGNGGDNSFGTFGEGGGGGGGLLYVKTSITPNVNTFLDGGVPGNGGASTADPGNPGEVIPGFKANLNGFLFNSIRSSVTGDTIDAVCSDMYPPRITGTVPVGGNGPYTYLWEKSYTGLAPWTELYNGPDSVNYRSDMIETSTVYYRRTVTSSAPSPLTDYSKVVKMVVQQAIADNNIVKDTTICSGQNPNFLRSNPLTPVPLNGTGVYSYKWLQNLNNAAWDTTQLATGTVTNIKYDPPALSVDTYYKRFVRSGRCINYSAAVKITVLTTLTGNSTIRSDSVICEGGSFPALGASAWSGGDPVKYWYQWQESNNGAAGTWVNAYGVSTVATYTADPLNFTSVENRYFRRVIYSGKDSVCQSLSVPILLTRYYNIQGNLIQKDQTICSGKKFLTLTGVTASPTGGTGSYSYKWEQSPDGTGSWTNVTRVSYSDTLGPQVLTANTWYRRVANSGIYKSLPVCTNTSPSVAVTVQPAIKNNTISLNPGSTDSTICSGATPRSITGLIPPTLNGGNGTVYTYKWKYSTNNSTWTDVPAATTPYYQPSSLTATTWYRRVALSGMCKDSANSVKINVLPPIVNTIPADEAVCINTPEEPVMGLTLSGGNTGQYKFLWESSPDGIVPWTNVTSDTIRTPDGANLQLPLLSLPVKYRRKVWSGPYNTCFGASNILSVSITPKPDPVFAGKDTLLRTFEYVYKLQALEPGSGTGIWSVPVKDKQEFDNIDKYNTYVRNLSDGRNTLLWTVTSSDGVCILDTTVNITVMNIVVPQGISPNGDGKNDILTIYGLDFNSDPETGKPYQLIDLTIRNSAGAQVYHTSHGYGDEWVEWDGKTDDGADLPEGTYYYMLNILSNRVNSNQPYKGFIILRRN